MIGVQNFMVPNDINVIKDYIFTITGIADGGATYSYNSLTLKVKCLPGIGYSGTYANEVKYPKVVQIGGAASTYIFPATFVGNLEILCPIISYQI